MNETHIDHMQLPDRLPARVDSAAENPHISTCTEINTGIDSLADRESPGAGSGRRRSTPRGVGKRQLDVIADGLSDRDRAVLRSLKQHRFLTTSQLERWHFSGHASSVTAGRIARRVLARMQNFGLLSTLQRRLGGVRAGSDSYVWHLTPAGERVLGAEVSGRRIREPSTAFLDHELGIAETHVRLIEAGRTDLLDLVDATSEPTCWRTFVGAGGQAVTLKPDLFAVTASGEFEDIWFVEYDRATESVQTIVKKASVYEAYRNSGREQQRSGVFPRVLWIVPTDERARRIRTALGKAATISAGLHQMTTPDQLIEAVTALQDETGAAR